MVERLQERGNDPGLRRFHIPAGILHEPGGAQKDDGQRQVAQALFRYLGIVQQTEFRDLGADRGQEDYLRRLCGGDGSFDRRDCLVRFRKAGFGVEVWRRHEKHAVHIGKRAGQTGRIRDRGYCDLAALIGPRPALVGVADNSPNRQSRREQSACNNASNLASDSGDGIHVDCSFP